MTSPSRSRRVNAWRTGMRDTPSFAAVVAEVEVDRETGEVSVRKVTCAYDVGTLKPRVVDTARSSHPFILEGGAHRASAEYRRTQSCR